MLSEGLNQVQLAELKTTLAGPQAKEQAFDQLNRDAMADPRLRIGMIGPPPGRR